MRFGFFFYLNFLFTTCLFSQVNLLHVRKEFYKTEKNRLENAIKLRDIYLDESPDSIYNIGSFLINEGIRKEQLSWLNFGKLIISSYYNKKGKTEISKEHLKTCISYYERKHDFEMLADAQNLMGVACMYELQNKEAIDWFLKSLNSMQSIDHENQSFMAQINMVEAFIRMEQFDSAEKEVNSFISKCKQLHLNKGLRKGYDLLAKIYFATNRIEKGIELYQKSLKLAYQNGDKLGLSFATNNMAIAYFEQGNLEKTLNYFEKALKLRKEINIPNLICESYFNLGEYYFFKEDYNQAKIFYQNSSHLAKKYNLLKENADAVQRIGECFEKQQDFQSAYRNSIQFASLQQKMLDQAKKDDTQINDNYNRYKEKELFLIQKKREQQLQKRLNSYQLITWMITITSILMASFFVFLVLRGRQNEKLEPLSYTKTPTRSSS